jgi:hypothetical protein
MLALPANKDCTEGMSSSLTGRSEMKWNKTNLSMDARQCALEVQSTKGDVAQVRKVLREDLEIGEETADGEGRVILRAGEGNGDVEAQLVVVRVGAATTVAFVLPFGLDVVIVNQREAKSSRGRNARICPHPSHRRRV